MKSSVGRYPRLVVPLDEPTEEPTGGVHRITIQPAVETDTAMPLRVGRGITIQPAVETDTAMPLRVVVAPSVVIAYAVMTHDGYHLPADHHDPIAYGTELGLVLALIFVCGRLVAGRLLRSS